MLTDVALKQLRPQQKLYKVADRDGMYVAVAPSGQITFRYDYRLAGRRETLTIGCYGHGGVSLAKAREQCVKARQAVEAGRSPAQEKQRDKRRIAAGETFGIIGKRWLKDAPMADSTRSMRKAIFDRDIVPVWKNRRLTEITPDDLRASSAIKVKDRGAPATAIHVRDIVKQIYRLCDPPRREGRQSRERGRSRLHRDIHVKGPGAFASRDPDRARTGRARRRRCRPSGSVFDYSADNGAQERVARCCLGEVDFENAVWSIPKERMKRSKAAQCLSVAPDRSTS